MGPRERLGYGDDPPDRPLTRRANGEGSRPAPRADGSWAANYTDRAGLRRTVYGRTAEDCRAKLADRIRERDTGAAARIDRKSTVAAYLTRWLASIDRTDGTRAAYAHIIRTQITPGGLGALKLVELDRDDVRGMMRRLEARGLAPATRRTALTVLRMALQDALGDGRVARNVAALAEMPSLTRTDRFVPPTAPQLRALLATLAAEDDPLHPLYVLAAHLGMRQGELVGLRWANVDLDAGVIHVREAWNKTAGTMGAPKTARGTRDLRLWPEAVAMLQASRARQLREGRSSREGFVFTGRTGRRVIPQTLGDHFRAVQVRAGIAPEGGRLDHFRFHDIRHAVATIMLEAGRSPAAVMAVMGHASIAVTVNLYGHVQPAVADTDAMVSALG